MRRLPPPFGAYGLLWVYRRNRQTISGRLILLKRLKSLVPDEGIEPPTFGLQNRCSTAELIRRFDGFCAISEASRAQERG